jgi:hypothetical protein
MSQKVKFTRGNIILNGKRELGGFSLLHHLDPRDSRDELNVLGPVRIKSCAVVE